MALCSSQLMCWKDSGEYHFPERWRFCQLAPHPVRDAFVKKNRLGSRRCRGTPWRTSCLLKQRSWERNSASSWIWVSQDCPCWAQCLFIKNCSNLRWRRPWWINGVKCEIRLAMEKILHAGMTVDVDRRHRSLVRESNNESGGDIMALSRLKCSPKKSRMREGSSIDFIQLIVHTRDCKSWMVCRVCWRLCSGESAQIIQSSR